MSAVRLFVSVLLCVVLTFTTRVALADEVETRPMTVRWADGLPRVDLAARDFAGKEVRDKLSSGLPQTLLARVYAFPSVGGRPIALGFHSCRVVYDLWDDVYRVQLQTATLDRFMLLRDPDAVVDACLAAPGVSLGEMSDFTALRGRTLYFSVLVELNPMSPDTVQRIRRWLARPGAGTALHGSQAFFGSFVSIFVNRSIGEAEQVLSYRSPVMSVPR